MTREEIREPLEEGETVLFLEGPEFDEAILGLLRDRWARIVPVVVYSRAQCVEIIQLRGLAEGQTVADAYEQAVEYFEFNTVGAFMGPSTPVFL